MTKNTVNYLLSKHGSELSIIAGSLGYYDGYSFTRTASCCELSLWTETPVILVVNGDGMGASIGAVIKGYLEYGKNNIKGIIFSNVKSTVYPFMKEECEKLGVKALGYFSEEEKLRPLSKHLGFVTNLELKDIRKKIDKLAMRAEETIDIDEILAIAEEAPEITYDFRTPERIGDVRIAYANDKAFCFYYEENLQLLKELGAELVPFSPLTDKKLPEDIDGLLLGDGYISLHAKALSENEPLLKDIHDALKDGLPCIAESGGFMYLHKSMKDFTGAEYKMAGVIDGKCSMADTQQGYFYITMKSIEDNMLCEKGEMIASYEIHAYESTAPGTGFVVDRGGWSMKRVNASDTLYAGFPHIHFYSNLEFAKNFVKACVRRKDKKN
jgi:cobyrinic acid a,c-diamide synthase